jgi:hypothetical protein
MWMRKQINLCIPFRIRQYMAWEQLHICIIRVKDSGQSWVANSVEQGPSWESSRFSASPEISHVLWNPNVHYCLHKRPAPVRIMSYINPVPANASHFLKFNFNIVFSFTFRSFMRSLSLRSPHQTSVCASPLPHTCHVPRAPPIAFFLILSP